MMGGRVFYDTSGNINIGIYYRGGYYTCPHAPLFLLQCRYYLRNNVLEVSFIIGLLVVLILVRIFCL